MARRMLNALSFCHADNIPEDLFSSIFDNKIDFKRALNVLTTYSMISKDKLGYINIHRLVQETIRADLKNQDNHLPFYLEVLGAMSHYFSVHIFNNEGIIHLNTALSLKPESLEDNEITLEAEQLVLFASIPHTDYVTVNKKHDNILQKCESMNIEKDLKNIFLAREAKTGCFFHMHFRALTKLANLASEQVSKDTAQFNKNEIDLLLLSGIEQIHTYKKGMKELHAVETLEKVLKAQMDHSNMGELHPNIIITQLAQAICQLILLEDEKAKKQVAEFYEHRRKLLEAQNLNATLVNHEVCTVLYRMCYFNDVYKLAAIN